MMSDPFGIRPLDATPIEPDPDFVATLRSTLRRRLTPDTSATGSATTATSIADPNPGATMANSNGYIPAGNASINAYLIVDDARAAMAWYRDVFDARVTYEPIIMEDGRVGHVEMTIGDTAIAFADEFPEMNLIGPAARGGVTASLMMHVPDADATMARGVELGGIEERPVADQFHGSRTGTLVDPFGHRWMVGTYLGEGGHPAGATSGTTQAADLWNEVGYYTIRVRDLAKAKRFWGGLFGWTFAPDNPAPDGGTGAHVESSVVPFGLHAPADWTVGTDGTAALITPYFRVRDLESAVAKVRELGGEVDEVDRHASGGGASCRDDQGSKFDLWEPAEGY